MKWDRCLDKYGVKTDQSGVEPFALLKGWTTQQDGTSARVSTSVGTSADYGSVKVSVTVSVDCPQNDACITMAGEATFLKAVELLNEGASYVGAPTLPTPQ